MSKIEINRWKDSAYLSLSNNEESIYKTGNFYFVVTTEQKEYLEDNISEIDDWCLSNMEDIPHTIKFEPFCDGTEDVFTCDCYFDIDELNEGLKGEIE